MSKNAFFRLNPECFLSMGPHRAVVHNLYSGEATWCDEPTSAALLRAESGQPVDDPPELFTRFAERGWGFFSDKPVFVDKLRTFNVFREKRLWRETPFAALAVLQVTNDCARACPTCTTAFCPICTSLPSSEASLSTDEWIGLIDALATYGTQLLLITGGEPLLHPDLLRLIGRAGTRGMRVQVHTTGLLPLPAALPADVALSVLLDDGRHVPAIVERFRGRNLVNALVDRALDPATLDLPAHWTVKRISAEPPAIAKADLARTPFERFFARRMTDECLNGKIYVAHDGRVYPCFGHRGEPVAGIRREGVAEAVRRLVEDWWNVGVDRREQACGACEFRYCCGACRFVDPGRSCSYDMTKGVWS